MARIFMLDEEFICHTIKKYGSGIPKPRFENLNTISKLLNDEFAVGNFCFIILYPE